MISFAQSLSKYLVDSFEKYFRDIFMFDNRRKKRPQFFFQRKVRLFSQKFDFSLTSWVLKNWSYHFHSICRKTCWTFTPRLWTLVYCSLRFIILDKTGKNGPKFLSLEDGSFLKCLFPSTSKVPKKWWCFLHN